MQVSPALDGLARAGAVLEQHYGQHVCTPSRAALLTGRYPIHTGSKQPDRQPSAWPPADKEACLAV